MTNAEAIETLRANYPDACYEQLREAVDKAIKALELQEWIPCDERMPEEEGHYLVTDESGGTAYVGSSQFLICDDGKFYWDFFDVTAWRPLPDPYRNGGAKA